MKKFTYLLLIIALALGMLGIVLDASGQTVCLMEGTKLSFTLEGEVNEPYWVFENAAKTVDTIHTVAAFKAEDEKHGQLVLHVGYYIDQRGNVCWTTYLNESCSTGDWFNTVVESGAKGIKKLTFLDNYTGKTVGELIVGAGGLVLSVGYGRMQYVHGYRVYTCYSNLIGQPNSMLYSLMLNPRKWGKS